MLAPRLSQGRTQNTRGASKASAKCRPRIVCGAGSRQQRVGLTRPYGPRALSKAVSSSSLPAAATTRNSAGLHSLANPAIVWRDVPGGWPRAYRQASLSSIPRKCAETVSDLPSDNWPRDCPSSPPQHPTLALVLPADVGIEPNTLTIEWRVRRGDFKIVSPAMAGSRGNSVQLPRKG